MCSHYWGLFLKTLVLCPSLTEVALCITYYVAEKEDSTTTVMPVTLTQ